MPPSRIVADGLWRALCPSFEALTVSRVRTPLQTAVRRANAPTRLQRARTGRSLQATRCSSTYGTTALPATEARRTNGDPRWDPMDASEPRMRQRRKTKFKIDFDSATTEELHDYLREIRDAQGAYNEIVDLVQYLMVHRGEKPSLRHFDALIRANADTEHGSAEVVEELLKEMDKEGIIGDSGLYHGVMMTLAVHPNHLLRAEILEEMRERWITLSPVGHAHLIISHLRDREYELALQVLEGMQTRAVPVPAWLYDIMIYVFSEAGEHATALQLLQQIAENPELNPLEPGSAEDVAKGVWPYFLDSAAAAFEYDAVFYVWRKRVEIGYVRPSDGTLMNVLNTAALAGDSELATSALKMLAERGGRLEVGAYEALLEAYCGSGDIGNAMRVLGIMERAAMGEGMSGVGRPDAASTRGLYMLLKDAGVDTIKMAWECLLDIQKEGGEVPVAAVNVCIEAAEMSGELELAMSFYNELKEGVAAAAAEKARLKAIKKEKKKIRWDRKAGKEGDAPAKSQDGEEPKKTEAKKILLATPPDATTINLLLQGCGKAFNSHPPHELKAKAMFLASEFISQGLKPTSLTYDRLILVCLGQADYEDALNYLGEMEVLGWRSRLRGGTWNALVRRLAREGDGRVEMLLEKMKDDGMPTAALRKKVDMDWKQGWDVTWEPKEPAAQQQNHILKNEMFAPPEVEVPAEPETEAEEVETESTIQEQLDAMFSADQPPLEEQEKQSKLFQFVKEQLAEPQPQPQPQPGVEAKPKAHPATVQPAAPRPAGSFAPKFGPLARR